MRISVRKEFFETQHYIPWLPLRPLALPVVSGTGSFQSLRQRRMEGGRILKKFDVVCRSTGAEQFFVVIQKILLSRIPFCKIPTMGGHIYYGHFKKVTGVLRIRRKHNFCFPSNERLS